MSGEVMIDVERVSKRFCRGLRLSSRYALADMTSELLTGRRHREGLRPGEFWALQDVSLQLRRGSAVGLVGRNGAGKTTLLRIIAGLIRADGGTVRVRGRVVPLLALGAAFSPALTGRENIVLNLSILGIPMSEIRARMDSIIAFSELASAIDAPVKSYSTGMTARLGFASAVHTEPDVLLIDEVLAVGDMAFRTKCYRRLNQMLHQGTAFVLVSHSAHSVLTLCETGLYLLDGRVALSGSIDDVMRQYEDALARTDDGVDAAAQAMPPPEPVLGFAIRSVFFRGPDGERILAPISGKPATLCLQCESDEVHSHLYAAAIISGYPASDDISVNLSAFGDGAPVAGPAGPFEIQIHLPILCLRPGSYMAKLSVAAGTGMNLLAAVEAFRFRVGPGATLAGSTFFQPREWRIAVTAVGSHPRAWTGTSLP